MSQKLSDNKILTSIQQWLELLKNIGKFRKFKEKASAVTQLKKKSQIIVLCTIGVFCLILLLSLIHLIAVLTDNSAELCKSYHDEKKYSESVPFCVKSCERDNGESCVHLAHFYSLDGETKDLKKEVFFSEKGCKLNNAIACRAFATRLLDGTVTQDIDKALLYFDKGCELGDHPSCDNLAKIYYRSQDYNKAMLYHDKECNLDTTGKLCNAIGQFYRPKDWSKAERYYEKSCDLNYGPGCANLGGLYIFGFDGVGTDAKLASKYLNKACNLKHTTTCKWLAKDNSNKEKKMDLLKKSCNWNDGEGCALLAEEFYKVKDYRQAAIYYDAACTLSYSDGCKTLSRLYTEDHNGWQHDYRKAMIYDKEECKVINSCERQKILGETAFKACKAREDYNKRKIEILGGEGDKFTELCEGSYSNAKAGYLAEQECFTLLKNKDAEAIQYCADLCNNYHVGGACLELGIVYKNGQGVKQDNEKVKTYLSKACDLSSIYTNTCYDIGVMYYNGDKVPQNKNIAQEFFRKSCSEKKTHCPRYKEGD